MKIDMPIVSICCLTYNHAQFIRNVLDGFLKQEPPTGVSADEPWFEILIHDDCSTDGTVDILRDYTSKHPALIFPIYETENQYSKGVKVDKLNYNRVRGKYIAYCEGDDYWTDSKKLQKQIDFMESHPDYSVCFHKFSNFYIDSGNLDTMTPPAQLLKVSGNPDGVDIDMETYFQSWFTQPLTMVFRVSMCDFSLRDTYKFFRDTHLIYYLLKAGKCRLMNFDGGVRNVHGGGIASMITNAKYCDISLPMDGEFYWRTKDKGPKRIYLQTLDASVIAYRKTNKMKAIRCALIRFFITGHPHSLVRNMKIIFGKK